MNKKPLILEYYKFDHENNIYLSKPSEVFKVPCLFCNQEIKASIRITSNLITHLKSFHKDQFAEFTKKRDEKLVKRKLDVGFILYIFSYSYKLKILLLVLPKPQNYRLSYSA